ncbi:MAG: DUF6273 domain-containing protein [Coprobacillaceae bacterium]
MALLLLLTGTFAWTSISQRATNTVDLANNPGGRVHDDFNTSTVESDGTANKDIYAENFGEMDIFVRIKLSEYLEVDGMKIAGGDKDDKSTWAPYVLGANAEARNYVTWEMGGDKIFLPTFNTEIDGNLDESFMTDASGNAIDDISGGVTALGDGSHDYFVDGQAYANPNGGSQTNTAKSTIIEDGTVMTMADWVTANYPTGNFWVIDTDGWAYWANPLAAGEATSLLLNELNFSTSALEAEEMHYAIDVIGEFATRADLTRFSDGSSAHGNASYNGMILFNTAAGGIPTKAGEKFADADGTGVVWRVLNPNDGKGNALIITEHVHIVGQKYNYANEYTTFESSLLNSSMQSWYKNTANVGDTLRNMGLNYADIDNSASEGKALALSLDEINSYIGNTNVNPNTKLIAKDVNGTPRTWWTRTQVPNNNDYPVYIIHAEGRVFASLANTEGTTGMRPALWVKR